MDPYLMYALTVVAAFVTAFLLTRPSQNFVRNHKKNPYSWRKEGKEKKEGKGEKKEEGALWASGFSPKEFVVRPRGEREGERLYDLFAYAAEEREESQIGWRQEKNQDKEENISYKWSTYSNYLTNIHEIGRGLRNLEIEAGSSFAVCDSNTHTSLATSLACSAHNVVVVGVNEKWRESEIVTVLSEMEVVGLQVGWEEWQRLKGVLGGVKTLKVVVVSGWKGRKGEGEKLKKGGIKVVGWRELKKTGKSLGEETFPLPPPVPIDTISFVSFTQGTIAPPKAIHHTHANLASSIASFDLLFSISHEDSYLSFLSFHHVFSLVLMMSCLGKGMKVGLMRGGKGLDASDLKEVRPSFLPIDTFLATDIRKKIEKTLSSTSPLTKWFFEQACVSRLDSIQYREEGFSFWTSFMFRETKRILGGNIRLFASFSPSPLPSSLHQFLRIFFGASVCQVYGLSEATAVASGMSIDDFSTGRSGGTLPSCLFRLQDVPQMGFGINDKPNPRGEIILSGLNVVQQGQNQKSNKEPTSERKQTINRIETGDVGEMFVDGSVKILGRKEQMVKDPDSGAYFSLELLETTYTQSIFVDFLSVFCGKDGVFAIISPNFDRILRWARDNHLKENEKQLVKNWRLKQEIMEDLKSYAEKSKFEGYQTLKKIHLVPDHWREEMETEDGGCVRVRGLCGGLGVNSTAVSSRYPHFIS